MSISRRQFLRRGSSALAAGSGLGLAACTEEEPPEDPTPPPDEVFGETTNKQEQAMLLPEAARPEGIFELYLYGGLAHWDTFYTVPQHGDPAAGGPYAGQGFWGFRDGPDSVENVFNECGGNGLPLLPNDPWATDSDGFQAFLGPWLYPLRDRPDIVRRMRAVVMKHDQIPHQTASALAQTGLRLGDPRSAGTAVHLQRVFQERTKGKVKPLTHVILPRRHSLIDGNADALLSLGLHPASARPVALWLDTPDDISNQLPRDWWGGRSGDVDALAAHYLQQYENRLRIAGRDSLARSPAFDDYRFARATLEQAGDLSALLPPGSFNLKPGESCGHQAEKDITTTGLRLAAQLLTDPTRTTPYVGFVDLGIEEATNFGGYDTHFFHVRESSRNIVHLMKQLSAQINEPDENDPSKFDLDRHTLLLTWEFGRTPWSEGELGTDHNPFGYVQIMIGGFVDEDRAGIVGAIDETGTATSSFSPGDFRAAMLLAMGVWPFGLSGFAVGDVSQGSNRLEAAEFLRTQVLGYPL